MKKNSVRAWIVLAIFIVAYQVLAFAIPFEKTGVFWLSYVFTDIAFIAQFYVVHSAFLGNKTVKSKFYGFPIAQIGVVYAAAQLILGFVFMALSTVAPIWIPLILYVLMLGAAAIGLISSEAMRDEIEHQDVKLKKDVSCMRRLQSKASPLVDMVKDPEAAKKVKEFSESLRFSDPVSSDGLADSEHELETCVDELQQAVTEGDTGSIIDLCNRANTLLAERNRLCKLMK